MSDVEKPEGYVTGRPTKYRTEFCEQVIEWMAQGKSKEYLAAVFKVNIDTIYEWDKVHKEFSDAIGIGTALSFAWWQDMGQENLKEKNFKDGCWAKQMSIRFRKYWRDVKEVSVNSHDDFIKSFTAGLYDKDEE